MAPVIYGFAFYIDTSNDLFKPQYVIFAEGLFETDREVSAEGLLETARGVSVEFMPDFVVVNDKSFVEKLICFRWKTGADPRPPAERVNCEKLFALEGEVPSEPSEYVLLPLLNTHLEIELDENESPECNFYVKFAFPPEWGVRVHKVRPLRLANDMAMVRADCSETHNVGVPQGKLGRCGTWIPRECFYLFGEALFSKDWVENKHEFVRRYFGVEDDITALVIALTLFINTRVRYTRDAFTVCDRNYDFEIFSDRTLLVGCGDCEDVAAWLLSAFSWIKAQGWCGNILRDYTPINILLRVASGTVEGTTRAGVVKSYEEHKETLDEYNLGGVHVTCMLIPTENLQALLEQKPIPSPNKDVYFAEGTAMVYPIFRRPVFNEQNSRYVTRYQEEVEKKADGFLRGFPGGSYGLLTRYIHRAVAGGREILHTAMQIMLNRTFEKDFDATIYLTEGEEPGGKYAYPITLESFFSGIGDGGKPILLKSDLPCTPEDKKEFIAANSLEPPSVVLLEDGDEIWRENSARETKLWKCVYFTTSQEAPANQLDNVKLPKYVTKMKLTPSLYILAFEFDLV